MTVTDLNKDGKLDLIVTNGGGITILLGKGNGTFAAPLHYALSAYTRAVVADFNGDGKLDVAVGAQGQVVDIFLGDGTGKLLTPPASFRVGGLPSGIVTADFTGDKKTDIGVAIGSEVVTLLHQ